MFAVFCVPRAVFGGGKSLTDSRFCGLSDSLHLQDDECTHDNTALHSYGFHIIQRNAICVTSVSLLGSLLVVDKKTTGIWCELNTSQQIGWYNWSKKFSKKMLSLHVSLKNYNSFERVVRYCQSKFPNCACQFEMSWYSFPHLQWSIEDVTVGRLLAILQNTRDVSIGKLSRDI